MPASTNAGNIGLDEYVLAISEAVATITNAASGLQFREDFKKREDSTQIAGNG
jgi:hypothetical protein